MNSESDFHSQRWMVVVAHPGHELRVLDFIARTRPLVAVLTDGSASIGHSRLGHTLALLEEVGATPATVFGRFTDRNAYARLMSGDSSAFVAAALELSAMLGSHHVTAIATDAAEGYNPVHDVCRVLAEAVAGSIHPAAPALFEFDLIGHPEGEGDGIRLGLDDAAFARKLDAIGRYTELAGEAQAAFDAYGVDAFRTEFLRRATPTILAPPSEIPYYERVGDERVQQGRYSHVLRYGAHVRPVMAALLELCAAGTHAPAFHPLH
jgi:hypothetical protein